MAEMQKEYGILTAEDLRTFLDIWPRFEAEALEAQQLLIEDKEKFLGKDAVGFSWCHLYELPTKQHAGLLLVGFLQDDKFLRIFKKLSLSPNQIAVLPEVLNEVGAYFDALDDPSKEEVEELRPFLASFLGVCLSVYHSLRCVLYHGCFLNELIQRVHTGDDKALFDAIRIDPTVIGCKSVIERISKAALLQDNRFFAKLKAALKGKMAKREQANFQKMRLVFEALYESGATRLSDVQLHQLFVEELRLWSATTWSGSNTKALRKFADTYMKKISTT